MQSLAREKTPRVLRTLLCVAAAVATFALPASAHAAQFKAVLCAAGTGANSFGIATNTASPQNPGGIFNFNNNCFSTSDPAGDNAFLRISENQAGGNAGPGAYGDVFYDAGPFVHFKTAGGYTREPNAFNEGWRARFLGIDSAGNSMQFMTQGFGLCNCNNQWALSGTFGPHVWPFADQLDFGRFVFELTCVRPAGCDRSNFNAADANTLVFTLNDDQDSKVAIDNTPFTGGQWVRGPQSVNWNTSDNGSGIHDEWLRHDGSVDYHGIAVCDTGFSGLNGEFARSFHPCPTGSSAHGAPFNTALIADGPHSLSVCTQDFGQHQGLSGTAGETCDARTVRTDNTAPGAPPGLKVTSANPARYLDRFDAHWSLPPNEGSPIAKVHYEILDAAGRVVVPEKAAAGADPTELADIEGPKAPGAYQLRVWLEDSVGLSGPASTAAIPHDTTPPAAPQDISVTPPRTARSAQGFDVRWRNIADAGSPVDAAHYEVLDHDGQVAVPAQTVGGDGVQAIGDLDTPSARGQFTLRLWLSDAEGNVGAPARVPLAYECQRSEVATGTGLSAGLGKTTSTRQVVQQDEGSLLKGRLTGRGGAGVADASLCVFSRVVTEEDRDFLGLAVSGADGRFQFAVPAGASRDLTVDYRSDHRELSAQATIETVVHPSFSVKKKRVYNKHTAFFRGLIPGPDNDNVVVNLQVKKGKGWLTFHRYRTRANGHYAVGYRFMRTFAPTRYRMRVQVRQQSGYPYVEGNSRALTLTVRPKGS